MQVPVALTGQRLRHCWPHLLGRHRSSATTAIRVDRRDIVRLHRRAARHNLYSIYPPNSRNPPVRNKVATWWVRGIGMRDGLMAVWWPMAAEFCRKRLCDAVGFKFLFAERVSAFLCSGVRSGN